MLAKKKIGDAEIIDLSLYFPKKRTLIISDIHIGYEESMNRKGILVPRFQFREMMQRLEKLFAHTKHLDKLIITGDLKHDFGTISEQEWREIITFIDTAKKHCSEIVILKGNHDKALAPIASKRDITLKDYEMIGDTYVCHGDIIPKDSDFKKSKRIIMGHEHPAIAIRDSARTERYKCFLVGKYEKKFLIVLPSFFQATEGTDILQEELLSPFLSDIRKFRIYVVLDKIYDFGTTERLLKGC